MFIIWALKYTNKVKTAADSHAEISDSPFTSIVLFVAIIMLVTLTVFYIIFTFAQNDLL
jgi:heme/copper-type cytochrome/quinol oxidase subunit 2